MTVGELYNKLEELYPRSLSAAWDNDGRMVLPDENREVRRVLCCLDCDTGALSEALRRRADVILTHHPLIFKPLKALDCANETAAKAMLLYKEGIAVLSFHTRLDCAEGGVNDALCDLLGLENRRDWILDGQPMGRIAQTGRVYTGAQFAALVKEKLGCPYVRMVLPEKRIETVALVGGSGGSFFASALAEGADAFLTGEASHHQLLDAREAGLCLISAGHDYTERKITKKLYDAVKALDRSIDVFVRDDVVIDTV